MLWLLIFATGCKEAVITPSVKPGWELTFSDEFTDTKLNTTVWRTGFYWGQASYTDDQHLFIDSAFFIDDGILHIGLNRDTVQGVVWDKDYNPVNKTFYYTAGMINTADYFAQQYGYFEARIKVPYGKGFWPAFWLMPYEKWPPEIDIMEMKGSEPTRLHMANHFRDKEGKLRQAATTINGPNFTIAFHIFAIEWNPKEIIWYLDNEKVFRTETVIPQEKMYPVVSVGIGGDYPGFADETTPFPSYMAVDYVRVYQKK